MDDFPWIQTRDLIQSSPLETSLEQIVDLLRQQQKSLLEHQKEISFLKSQLRILGSDLVDVKKTTDSLPQSDWITREDLETVQNDLQRVIDSKCDVSLLDNRLEGERKERIHADELISDQFQKVSSSVNHLDEKHGALHDELSSFSIESESRTNQLEMTMRELYADCDNLYSVLQMKKPDVSIAVASPSSSSTERILEYTRSIPAWAEIWDFLRKLPPFPSSFDEIRSSLNHHDALLRAIDERLEEISSRISEESVPTPAVWSSSGQRDTQDMEDIRRYLQELMHAIDAKADRSEMIDALEDRKINHLLEGKVDQGDFDRWCEEIFSRLPSISLENLDDRIRELSSQIERLQKKKADKGELKQFSAQFSELASFHDGDASSGRFKCLLCGRSSPQLVDERMGSPPTFGRFPPSPLVMGAYVKFSDSEPATPQDMEGSQMLHRPQNRPFSAKVTSRRSPSLSRPSTASNSGHDEHSLQIGKSSASFRKKRLNLYESYFEGGDRTTHNSQSRTMEDDEFHVEGRTSPSPPRIDEHPSPQIVHTQQRVLGSDGHIYVSGADVSSAPLRQSMRALPRSSARRVQSPSTRRPRTSSTRKDSSTRSSRTHFSDDLSFANTSPIPPIRDLSDSLDGVLYEYAEENDPVGWNARVLPNTLEDSLEHNHSSQPEMNSTNG